MTIYTELCTIIASFKTDILNTSDTMSSSYEERILTLYEALSRISYCMEQNQFFSLNEDIEEISGKSLLFLLVPYYMGELAQRKKCVPQMEFNTASKSNLTRVDIIQITLNHYKDFLILMSTYKLIQDDVLHQFINNQSEPLNRNKLICFTKEQMKLEEELYILNDELNVIQSKNKNSSESFDEKLRIFHMKTLKWAIGQTIRQNKYLHQELDILKQISMQEKDVKSKTDTNISRKNKNSSDKQLNYTILPGGMIATHSSINTMPCKMHLSKLTHLR